MTKIDWNNPEERNAYHRKHGREYRAKNQRMTLTFTPEEYQWVDRSAKHYDIPRVSRHVKLLAIEAAKMGLGEQIQRPPQVPEEITDEILFLLHNCANNINQIARNLNERALETSMRPVAGYEESVRILHALTGYLQDTEKHIRQLTEGV